MGEAWIVSGTMALNNNLIHMYYSPNALDGSLAKTSHRHTASLLYLLPPAHWVCSFSVGNADSTQTEIDVDLVYGPQLLLTCKL